MCAFGIGPVTAKCGELRRDRQPVFTQAVLVAGQPILRARAVRLAPEGGDALVAELDQAVGELVTSRAVTVDNPSGLAYTLTGCA
ncbi:hypothetical protein GCM10027569_24950 [Flindersiella endophytica]